MSTTDGVKLGEDDAVRTSVSKYYGETLQASSDLLTSACCTAKAPPREVRDVLARVPAEILQKYYGCGSPFPAGLQGSGLRVLDLGCGSGRDCYVCAALVGAKGFVTGIDMTPQQLEVAKRHQAAWQQQLGYEETNMRFVQGEIEKLSAAGIAPGSVDLIISNCVVNLSPDKAAVLREAYQALAPGGELYFSDVYCDRRLAQEVRCHEVLLGECLGGALAVNDFLRLATQVGFADPRVLEVEPIAVHDAGLKQLLGDAAFYSVTFRLFKLPGQLEAPPQEDYGQSVTYKGSLPGAPDSYTLDRQHTFATGVPVRVSGNTAAMAGESWLGPHFSVTGDKAKHLGQFGGSSSSQLDAAAIAAMAAGASGGGGSSCCPPAKAAAAPAAAQANGGGGGCCAPKPSSSCCPPAAPAPAAAAGASGGGGCCAPKPAPAAASGGGGCCAPKPAAAAESGGGCCAPKPAAASTGGGCCAPKPAAASTGGGCCAPKPAAASTGGGCGPKAGGSCCPAPAEPAAPAEAQPKPSTCGGGKCC